MFALRLLRDGTRDPWSYSCASRKHAPPLIMGYFDSGIGGAEEKVLELEVLGQMCEQAGRQMIRGGGYAHWLDVVRVPEAKGKYRIRRQLGRNIRRAVEVERRMREEEGGEVEGIQDHIIERLKKKAERLLGEAK